MKRARTRPAKSPRLRVASQLERLEDRCLLSADLFSSSWTMPPTSQITMAAEVSWLHLGQSGRTGAFETSGETSGLAAGSERTPNGRGEAEMRGTPRGQHDSNGALRVPMNFSVVRLQRLAGEDSAWTIPIVLQTAPHASSAPMTPNRELVGVVVSVNTSPTASARPEAVASRPSTAQPPEPFFGMVGAADDLASSILSMAGEDERTEAVERTEVQIDAQTDARAHNYFSDSNRFAIFASPSLDSNGETPHAFSRSSQPFPADEQAAVSDEALIELFPFAELRIASAEEPLSDWQLETELLQHLRESVETQGEELVFSDAMRASWFSGNQGLIALDTNAPAHLPIGTTPGLPINVRLEAIVGLHRHMAVDGAADFVPPLGDNPLLAIVDHFLSEPSEATEETVSDREGITPVPYSGIALVASGAAAAIRLQQRHLGTGYLLFKKRYRSLD
ncbi:hypothetical protein [Aureliella helgolandensis]|uniref:Uncharacterized protein n=1 Tax=Aureliella helgolandensis TaxID=2527968 RepID=A0A518G412_9BACT|nr:hypothetical protein [Aureliella helgolandensis]QDV23332.1 hypothetical protein Q31a_16300 [Aureliella helgolandensis]